MRLQLLDILYWDIGYFGFSILAVGWHEHALLSLNYEREDTAYGARLTGSILWFNFRTGGKKKDTFNKFKDRYIIAEGYPWTIDKKNPLVLYTSQQGWVVPHYENPREFITNSEAPKYRLVLERVKPKRKVKK